MKHKSLNFIIVALFYCSLSGLEAQTMYIRPVTGTQSAYSISNIQKITFSGSNWFYVTPISGTVDLHYRANNRYINFIDLTLSTETQQHAATDFYVYPNPVQDVLTVAMDVQGQPIDIIAIFTIEGQLVLQEKLDYNTKPQISVTSLAQGMYLCKISSGIKNQTIKFIKH